MKLRALLAAVSVATTLSILLLTGAASVVAGGTPWP
jgi:hypothetical protein